MRMHLHFLRYIVVINFKEALLSCDEEWSQHKKVIETSQKGFRYSITNKLPYFHVWFGLDKGYGHIIEDQTKFPKWTGKVRPTF